MIIHKQLFNGFFDLAILLFLLPLVAWLYNSQGELYHRIQAKYQQHIHAHSVEIEVQDGGGYQVVE